MAKYRTRKHFKSIVENCNNGNWGNAADQVIEHGFSATDLKTYDQLEIDDETGNHFDSPYDIAILMEIVGEHKLKIELDELSS